MGTGCRCHADVWLSRCLRAKSAYSRDFSPITVGETTINYAELFSIYLLLQWIHDHRKNTHSSIHFFTDSMYTQQVLCSDFIPKKNFILIEEIKNLASRITDNFSLMIHWIPSHIENTIFGKRPIIGNQRADDLAKSAQVRATDNHTRCKLETIRDQILFQSAFLISEIDKLLELSPHSEPHSDSELDLAPESEFDPKKSKKNPAPIPHPTDGPSSDDFSSADAIRDKSFSRDVP